MYYESLYRSGIIDLIDKSMPSPGSKRGYNPSAYIVPLNAYYARRRKSYREHIREINNDTALMKLLY